MLLSKQEDESIWNRIFDELQFNPNSVNRSHNFTNNLPFKIDKPFVVYAIENMTDEQIDKMERLIKRVFIQATKKGDKIYALDWQHSSFLYNPREDSEQKSYWVSDSRYMGGGYSAYFPSYYPDGDYYFFIAENFDFGYLGHPWRKEVWIWGESFIVQFQQIYKELGWDKLYSYLL